MRTQTVAKWAFICLLLLSQSSCISGKYLGIIDRKMRCGGFGVGHKYHPRNAHPEGRSYSLEEYRMMKMMRAKQANPVLVSDDKQE